MFSYYAVKFLSRILCLLPHGIAMALGAVLARLAWIFVPAKRRTLAREQIMRCLDVSEPEAERIARESSLRFGPMLMEVLRFPVMKPRMRDYVTITGAMDEVRAAIAGGRGAIFATSHSGNWELMGGAFACAGLPIVGVAKRQSSAGMDRFINEYRTLVGMHVTYRTGVREMFRMIDEGWIIGLISDQDPSLRDGVVIDFFGQRTNAFTGAAAIARRCGVPIFPVFIHREPNGHHILTVQPGIMVEKTDDRAADVKRVTQIVSRRIEAWIRTYPEEWFWLHDRWKSLREEQT
ncbi:lipid A biosynthesis acyltransferase [Selenomonas sp. oral taxon 920]|uniref:lysophospholipid acyltransferase family protein n=1 Tax=Selenomonas sp. oral taxon 920 TaxID=1884263 RepID=UPI000840C25C|nr:lysophospholipid acyltransferase family protein [Selenomonas sp. oral taxon 920]AOH47269.1 lipid A biosynthesis acyltransferase [Selenomonas sp. oral taxon 920]